MPGFYTPSETEFDPETDDFVIQFLSKERRYRHFDLPLRGDARKQVMDFSREDAPHRFLPLLDFTESLRRYTRNKTGKKEQKVKERNIRYASHEDSAYLQAYSDFLNKFYEDSLRADGTSASVLAYRRGGGTNIHHAKALFDEIGRRQDCTVVAMDISGFFDCLDHKILRDEIARAIGVTRLEKHHATVWKNITKYSWVETRDIDDLLGKRRNAHGRICSQKDFIDEVRGRSTGLVRTHGDRFGIPQGTPISGLYANIYLRTFDRQMMALVGECGGSYRRYSDDIAVVLPLGTKGRLVVAVTQKMLADVGLAMSEDKTEVADFKGGLLVSPRPLQYLGFTFDGKKTLIRPSSLDAYRAKMSRGIHAKMVAASAKRIPSFEVFKRESLSRYTHLGKRRNFLRYAYRASEVMGCSEIRAQVKGHVKWFQRAWEREATRVYGSVVITT